MTPLHSDHEGETAHIRRVFVDEAAPERESCTASFLSQNRPDVWPAVVVPESLDDCHAVIRRTAKKLSSWSSDATKMLSAAGREVLSVYVSQGQKERALRVLQGCVAAFVAAGGSVVVPTKQDDPGVHLRVIEQFVSMKIEELMDRSFREPTAKECAEQERYSWSKPDLRVYTPNGKLKLTILSDDKYSPYLSVSDGVSPIGDRLNDLVERVWMKAAERKTRAQMRQEEDQRWEEAWARRQVREAERKAQLDRLEETEKSVQRWHRAGLLRAYADALENRERDSKTPASAAEVAWIRNAADYLDPLVVTTWPDMDDDD